MIAHITQEAEAVDHMSPWVRDQSRWNNVALIHKRERKRTKNRHMYENNPEQHGQFDI
jgi:hypothetical protein